MPPRSALLECMFALECVADRKLDVGRFLPPLPLRTVVDTRLNLRSDYRPHPASIAIKSSRRMGGHLPTRPA